MNFQQLKYVREAVRQGLNLTEAANVLFTSQPGISKQIRELEDELGIEIFVRRGKRLVDLTEPGRTVVQVIERLLAEADNLRQVGKEFADRDAGALTIATTHTQARYALPKVVQEFRAQYPKVRLSLQQGSPTQIADMVLAGQADIAIATEALDHYPELLALAGYTWHHCVIVPHGHPLTKVKHLSVDELARYPLITYSPEFTGRSHIDQAFAAKGLKMDVVLTAIDADVIKTYAELGLGVGIIAAMAYDPKRDAKLHAIDAGPLFHNNTTRIAIKRAAYLRRYTYAFIEMFAPHLTQDMVDKARLANGESYEL
ncbi:MAG TPA: CysB family HTH-type transcriptional regulator [Burkholderiales bacterium]|nr:CysB family HTH-type transcriptional regulator [Burkholderiales bacterium]